MSFFFEAKEFEESEEKVELSFLSLILLSSLRDLHLFRNKHCGWRAIPSFFLQS